MSAPTYRGNAIPVMTLEPDWNNPVVLSVGYRSSTFEALDTSEERHGLSPRPLYGLTYQALTMSGAESGYCRRITDLSGAVPICCPVWTDYVEIASAVSIGTASLTVTNTQNSLWQVLTGWALIRSDWRTWEIVTLASVGSTTINLTGTTSKAWAVGARLYPVLFGRLARQDWTAMTDEASNVPIEFHETFNLIGDQSLTES